MSLIEGHSFPRKPPMALMALEQQNVSQATCHLTPSKTYCEPCSDCEGCTHRKLFFRGDWGLPQRCLGFLEPDPRCRERWVHQCLPSFPTAPPSPAHLVLFPLTANHRVLSLFPLLCCCLLSSSSSSFFPRRWGGGVPMGILNPPPFQ